MATLPISHHLDPRLPNFFLAGVPKAGTTSLAAYLNQHPSVYMSKPKEPHFFEGQSYTKGIDFYVNTYFANAESFPRRGDATPSKLYEHTTVLPRLQVVYGSTPLKFIVIFRDPVARAWSEYLHLVSTGEEVLGFDSALAAKAQRVTQPVSKQFHYICFAESRRRMVNYSRGRQRYQLVKDPSNRRK